MSNIDFEKEKHKLFINIKSKEKNKGVKSKIIINEKIDLNKLLLYEIINTNLLNFGGNYFNKLYENAKYEELLKNNERIIRNNNPLLRYSSKNNELFPIYEEEYNEIKQITKIKRTIKSDNYINKIFQKDETMLINNNLNQVNSSNRIFKLQKIFFEIKYDTFLGQNISIIGSIDKLGNWNENRALNMTWNEGNIWKTNFDYDNLTNFEYKFVFMENGYLKKWEDGINRIFSLAQLKNLLEPNLINGNIIKLNNIMNQSIEYNYNDYSLTIISEWNKKSM